jgi:hypothetical protein
MTKEEKAKWFSGGRPGARKVEGLEGGNFVKSWSPTLRGRIVCCPDTSAYKFASNEVAKLAAKRFKKMCEKYEQTTN